MSTDALNGGGRLQNDAALNPHHRLHKVIYRIIVVCLFAQVIEGSLVVPYVLVYFGFPQLSLTEVCNEMHKIAYADESRECLFPYPLFGEPEPWQSTSHTEAFGPSTPSAPGWVLPGFRGAIELKKQREARQAAAKNSAALIQNGTAVEKVRVNKGPELKKSTELKEAAL